MLEVSTAMATSILSSLTAVFAFFSRDLPHHSEGHKGGVLDYVHHLKVGLVHYTASIYLHIVCVHPRACV